MATVVLISGGFKIEVEVDHSFDEALEKVYPLHPPTSALEGRALSTWTVKDGERVWFPQPAILMVREDGAD